MLDKSKLDKLDLDIMNIYKEVNKINWEDKATFAFTPQTGKSLHNLVLGTESLLQQLKNIEIGYWAQSSLNSSMGKRYYVFCSERYGRVVNWSPREMSELSTTGPWSEDVKEYAIKERDRRNASALKPHSTKKGRPSKYSLVCFNPKSNSFEVIDTPSDVSDYEENLNR